MSKVDSTADGSPMTKETGFQRDLLVAIGRLDDPHGLAIKDELEQYYDSEIHHGRIYPNLDELVAKGLVEKGSKDRRTNEYSLTGRGRREMQADRRWREGAAVRGDRDA